MGKIDGTKLHTRLATSTLFQNGLINVCLNTKKTKTKIVLFHCIKRSAWSMIHDKMWGFGIQAYPNKIKIPFHIFL